MNTQFKLSPVALSLAVAIPAGLFACGLAHAQCTQVASNLRDPLGIAMSPQGNLFVSETGTTALPGRISIVDLNGNRRTLLDGLPSAINDVNETSGPVGLLMRDRNLYVAIGTGDVGIPGPRPGATLENPNGPSSPMFASILAIHMEAGVEAYTHGFTLTPANQQALADGHTVTLRRPSGSAQNLNQINLRLFADFPDFVPAPQPDVPDNIELSNPFGLVAVGETLYVTDGGRNHVWRVDRATGVFSPLIAFPAIPNPMFPGVGGPFIQAVPTGIASVDGHLLVNLFRGAPFATGTSTVEQIDPTTGSGSDLIAGLTTSINTIATGGPSDRGYLVLEHSSVGPFFAGPGRILHYDNLADPPSVVAECLSFPTSMVLDENNGTIYVSQRDGSIVSVPFE